MPPKRKTATTTTAPSKKRNSRVVAETTKKETKQTSNKRHKRKSTKQEDDEEETEAEEGGEGSEGDLPFDQWRVVLTGEFVGKAAFEQTLKSRGVAITAAVSGKTTHLLLGRTVVNEYGQTSGVGSSKHTQAQERGLPILTQPQVMRVLSGQCLSEATSKPKAPPKSATVLEKIVYCVASANDEQKLSLAKLKGELEKQYGMDCTKAQTKTSLKKALDKAVEEAKLVKDGGSYNIPMAAPAALSEEPNVKAAAAKKQDSSQTREARLRRMAPKKGYWKGLRVLSSKPSKTGRAKCVACGELIEKGHVQVELRDDSLFSMLTRKGALHEGTPRPYVECGYSGGHDTVAPRKFFVHDSCQEDTNAQMEEAFHNDWATIQPEVFRESEGVIEED